MNIDTQKISADKALMNYEISILIKNFTDKYNFINVEVESYIEITDLGFEEVVVESVLTLKDI